MKIPFDFSEENFFYIWQTSHKKLQKHLTTFFVSITLSLDISMTLGIFNSIFFSFSCNILAIFLIFFSQRLTEPSSSIMIRDYLALHDICQSLTCFSHFYLQLDGSKALTIFFLLLIIITDVDSNIGMCCAITFYLQIHML
jgi:hypothetical protein